MNEMEKVSQKRKRKRKEKKKIKKKIEKRKKKEKKKRGFEVECRVGPPRRPPALGSGRIWSYLGHPVAPLRTTSKASFTYLCTTSSQTLHRLWERERERK